MGRVLLALTAALLVTPPAGAAPPFSVAVVPGGVPLAALDDLSRPVALGLVVPDAGPRTSEARARASLERGEVVNSLREQAPEGRRLVRIVDRALAPLPPPGDTLFVGIPRGGTQRNSTRYGIALVGRERGLLTSDSTRIPGLVAIADIAHGRLAVQAHGDPVAYLVDLDRRIAENGDTRWWATLLTSVVTLGLALVAPFAALLAPAALLVANLVLGVAGISDPPVAVTLLVAAVLAAYPLARLLERTGPRRAALAGGVLAGTVALYFAAFLLDQTWVALSPLGPGQNARFYGLSNLLETVLLVPALAGAALLTRRFGWPALAAVAAVSLVTVAGSRFGADGGGAIVLAAGFAVLAAAQVGGGRRALLVGGAVATAAVAVIAVDALVGPATHVGETVRGGPAELARDLVDRVELSWQRATDTGQTAAVVAASIAALAVLVARGPRRDLPLAVAAAIAVSLVVNDSPKEVAAGGVIAYLTVARLAGLRPRSLEGPRLDSYAEARRREPHEAQVRP